MSRDRTPPFAQRPGDPDRWVRSHGRAKPSAAETFTARLTIDVTPVVRGRLKIVAFRRGQTVADMVRALLDREFPDEGGGS
jgi:hypothetical protein